MYRPFQDPDQSNKITGHLSYRLFNWPIIRVLVQLCMKHRFFFMFGRQARLPVDRILGTPHVGNTAHTEVIAQKNRDNSQNSI